MHFGQKAVSVPRNRLDIAGTVGGIPQSRSQLVHGLVQAAIEVDKRVLGPKPLPDFFPSDQVTGMLHEKRQYLEGLVLQLDSDAALSQLGRFEVNLKGAKTFCPKDTTRDLHRHPSSYIAKRSTHPYVRQYMVVARRRPGV